MLVPESDWVDLVHAINLGNEASFHALFERTHRLVCTLIYRITGERRIAEQLTIEVFWDIWTRAARYTLEKGPVVAWIMNEARQKVNQRLPHAPRGLVATDDRAAPATEVLSQTLWARLSQRIGQEGGPAVSSRVSNGLRDAQWREVAPGITCKLLSTDRRALLVSMLVRLAPGGEYPGHTHAGTEELHLLEGELWIDDRKLHPGDYNRAVAGTADARVWSETGCLCVLITSTLDRLA